MTKEMLKQFHKLKKMHPDALLLFHCVDFYEAYGQDAKACAKLLGIVLTKQDGQCLAAFPRTALDNYLPRLIRAGHRIALCDQLEDPRKRRVKEEEVAV